MLHTVCMETLYSVEEAARRLGGLSKHTIHKWLIEGRIMRTKVGGRTMIRESELEKMLEDGAKSPAPSRWKKHANLPGKQAEKAVSRQS